MIIFFVRFYLEFFIFGLFFILNAVTLFLKRIYYDHLSAINCTIMTNESNYLSPECECAYLNSEDDQKYVNKQKLFLWLFNRKLG